jgi:hypothetical protein
MQRGYRDFASGSTAESFDYSLHASSTGIAAMEQEGSVLRLYF